MEPDGQEEEEELQEDKYADHEEDGDDEDEEDGEEAAGSEEEDQFKVKQKKMPEIDPVEEAEFEKELRALMQESVESRKLDMRARPTLNMMIPMNLLEATKEHPRSLEESGDEITDDQGSENITFHVLVKKGNKQQTKQLHIPRDSSLVQSTKQNEAAELVEKQDIKRLVLEYNEREEEDISGMVTQPLNWGVPSASNLSSGRGGGRGDYEAGPRIINSRQRRPVAAGYSRRR